jgi:tRNA threonylcarbamoyladenosine biosynthesis protein TsaE
MTVLSLNESELIWMSPSPEASLLMGEALGRLLQPGDFVALFGELGSGKTLLVRGVATGLGCVAGEVHSPSFTLVNEYSCRGGVASPLARTGCALAHIDLYRIRSEDEIPGIGWDEYLGAHYVVLVEWAERAAGCLPRDHLRVRLEACGPQQRRVCVQATGPRSGRVLRGWVGQMDVRLEAV